MFINNVDQEGAEFGPVDLPICAERCDYAPIQVIFTQLDQFSDCLASLFFREFQKEFLDFYK